MRMRFYGGRTVFRDQAGEETATTPQPLHLEAIPCAGGFRLVRFEDEAGRPYKYSRRLNKMVRDEEEVAAGARVGSHPSNYKLSHNMNGSLTVLDARGEEVCTYAAGAYEAHRDGDIMHVHKTGNFDLAERLELEPEEDDRQRDYDGDHPPPPEDDGPRMRWTHDSTQDNTHMATLRAMNKRNRAITGVADESPMPGFPRVRENPNPQQQQNGLKALNRKHREHYGR
jgi:hypothetical protein